MKKITIILAGLLLLKGATAFGQNDKTQAKKKLMPCPPIYGIPAKTLPQGKFIYRSYLTFTSYSQMYSATKEKMVSLPDGMNFTAFSYTPKLRYGITNKLTLIANFPLYYKTLYNNGTEKYGKGLGDIKAALLYRFYFNKSKKFLLSGLLFSKYPIGKYMKLDDDEMPLGSGSYDGGIALLPEKEFGKWDMRLSAFYIYRSKNKLDVDLGDVQSYSFSSAYNFSKNFIAEGTVLYKSTFNNKKNDVVLPNTYTNLTQVVIGAQYRLARTFLLQAAIPITISAKTPFASKYDIWFGIYYLL